MKTKPVAALLGVLVWSCGIRAVNIDLVNVLDAGNAADTRYASPGYGSVAYEYQIGKHEVTLGQYCAFLNAVAASDPLALYAEGMLIQRGGSPGTYTYSVSAEVVNRPVDRVSWGSALRFINWLENDQPTGAPAAGTTEDGSYYLNGATSSAQLGVVERKPGAGWVLPTEDEWYKAAYYDPGKPGGAGYWQYPTRNNARPSNVLNPLGANNANFLDSSGHYTVGPPYYLTEVGAFANSPSAYGTFDQGGNALEWNQARFQYANGTFGMSARGGGAYFSGIHLSADDAPHWVPPYEQSPGFRVAYVPEPSALVLLLLGGLLAARCRA